MIKLSALLPLLFAGTLIGGQESSVFKGPKRPGPVQTDIFNDRPSSPPRHAGELTQAVDVGFRSLDSYQDTSALTQEVGDYIEEGLISSDVETWDHTPSLAESWETEDVIELKDGKTVRGKASETAAGYDLKDLKGAALPAVKKGDVKEVRYGTSFTFHLRKGVKFQDAKMADGTEYKGLTFSAKDVEFMYKLLSNPKNGMPSIQSYFAKITECAILDDYTVRMTYSEQYWMALGVCAGYIRIRPAKAWDPNGDIDKNPDEFFKKLPQHPLTLHPIGTGAYQFDSYTKDFEVVIKRFDGWWGAGKPGPTYAQNPDRIRFRIIKDKVAQLQALKNGEVDYAEQIPPDQFDDFFKDAQDQKNFAAVTILYPMYRYVGFNLRRDLWKDKKVRWAMAHASIDLEKFIKEVLKGRGERVAGDYYKYSDEYNTDLKPVPYDPKKAEELLGEAGWYDSDGDGILDKDKRKFEFELLVRELPPTNPMVQLLLAMQANLKKLGIKMEIRKLEWGAFLEKIEKGDFDICLLGWAMASPPNRMDLFQIWHSSQIGEAGSNHVAYANQEVDRLLVDIRREMDAKKRNELAKRLQKVIFDDQPYNWLYMQAEHRIYSKKWRGVRFWVPRPCTGLMEWYLEGGK